MNKESEGDNMINLTVPCKMPLVLSQADGDRILNALNKTPITKEQRTETKRKVQELFRKPVENGK